jgi:hypothetical protein
MGDQPTASDKLDKPWLFAYPPQTRCNKIVHKNKLFASLKPRKKVRDLITSEIAQILWQHELAPQSLNLTPDPQVGTIQVFRITLKPAAQPELHEDVFRHIDQAIPSPIFFELIQPSTTGKQSGRIRCLASYKRLSEADSKKWVVGSYFQSPWLSMDAPRDALPVALDMGSLYEQMLRKLMAYPAKPAESIRDQALRLDQITVKQREYQRLEAQMHKLKQFNRKVELNSQLKQLRNEIESLTQ